MTLLLDTHALPCFSLGVARLSGPALATRLDPLHVKLVSPASLREIAIKRSLGQYVLNESLGDFVQHAVIDKGFAFLPIEAKHVEPLINLPDHHRDPFDRLLIAEAMAESIPVLGTDRAFDRYPIQRVRGRREPRGTGLAIPSKDGSTFGPA